MAQELPIKVVSCQKGNLSVAYESYINILYLERRGDIVPLDENITLFDRPRKLLTIIYYFLEEAPQGGIYTHKEVLSDRSWKGIYLISQPGELRRFCKDDRMILIRDLIFNKLDIPVTIFSSSFTIYRNFFATLPDNKMIGDFLEYHIPSCDPFEVEFFERVARWCEMEFDYSSCIKNLQDNPSSYDPSMEILESKFRLKLRKEIVPLDILTLGTVLYLKEKSLLEYVSEKFYGLDLPTVLGWEIMDC